MIEEKILNTKTIVTQEGSNLSIYTFYQRCSQYLVAFISSIFCSLYKENELVFIKDGYDDISYNINNKGELIVIADNTKDFSLNANDELIMVDNNPLCGADAGPSSFLIGGYSAINSLARIDTDLLLTYLGNIYGSEFDHFFYLNNILFGSGWNAAYTETFFKYSTDLGVTWTDVPTTIYEPINGGLVSGMAYNGIDKYVLTIKGDLLTNTIAYSSNGMSWTGAGNTVFALGARCVIWDDTKFIAGGDGTDNINVLAHSINGTSWIGLGYTSSLLTCNSLAYNGDSINPIYVAVGNSPTTPNTVLRSIDGLTWTGIGTPAFDFAGYKVIFKNDRFIAIGITYTSDDLVAYSANGTDWISSYNALNTVILLDIAWIGDRYIIVGYNGVVSVFKYSFDLINYVDIANTFEYINTIFV